MAWLGGRRLRTLTGMVTVVRGGRSYTVQDGKYAQENAALLQMLEMNTATILQRVCQLQTTHEAQSDIRQAADKLLARVRARRITFEQQPHRDGLPPAVNIGKGRVVKICLRESGAQEAVGSDVLNTVLVHELAHMMEDEVGKKVNGRSVHSDVFKRNERYLLGVAIELGLVPEGGTVGLPFCGQHIPDPQGAQ